MEMVQKEYASKGAASTGVALGASGLGVALLNGGLNTLLGGRNAIVEYGREKDFVTEKELTLVRENDTLKSQIALRDASIYTDNKLNDFRNYIENKFDRVDHRFTIVEKQIAEQAVWNATQTSTIGCIAQQVAQLQGLAQLVIPARNVCEPNPIPVTVGS